MLCQAAAQNEVNVLRTWISAGIDINVADYDGRTALHVVRREARCMQA